MSGSPVEEEEETKNVFEKSVSLFLRESLLSRMEKQLFLLPHRISKKNTSSCLQLDNNAD